MVDDGSSIGIVEKGGRVVADVGSYINFIIN